MTEDATPQDEPTRDESTQDESTQAPAPGPAFSVVSGEPTDEELAALTVVLLAATSGDTPAAPKRVTGSWSDPVQLARYPVRHGIGGWRAGARR